MTDGRGGHPGPTAASLPSSIHEAIIAQARDEYPNEACGLIVGDAPAGIGMREDDTPITRNTSRFVPHYFP